MAIAEKEGVEPNKLSVPLYSVINPDSLDTLFHSDTGTVTFEYHGYEVTVDASGVVRTELLKSE